MVNLTQATADLREENIQRAVNGFALQSYKFKQVCLIQSSSSWKETYFEEGSAELTASGTRNIKGVSRGANFPYVEPNWVEKSVRHQKYAAEGLIYWEDAITNSIDVMQRTLLRVARAITKSVDDEIYQQWITASGINTGAASANWDSATLADRDPIRDILTAIQTCSEDNYDVQENGFLLLSPKDYRNLMMNSKVINNPSFKTADIVSNGRVGQVVSLNIIVSNSVPADEALVIKGQEASTWKTAKALQTKVIEDHGIKFTIRGWEVGITQVTNPKAIYRITNTQL